ncbi:MAG: type II toxin-antitoxin system RelE/ParE family toxin [Burkholderiaceae bacterium]
MRLFITPLAEQDLEQIGDYIAQDNPKRANSFVNEMLAQCRKICLKPAAYRLRPELSNELRSCAHGRYVIFFESSEEQVTIIRILHGARELSTKFWENE